MKNNIRTFREKLNLTQDELATRTGVTRQTINAIENNKYNPTLALAFKIARLFGKSMDDVFIYEKGVEQK